MVRLIARISLGLALCVVVIAAGTTAQARAYENFNYGFEVTLPPGMRLCVTPPPGPNHGFALSDQTSDCDDDDRERIDFFTAYNIPYDASSTTNFSKKYCDKKLSRTTAYNIGGLKFRVCSIIEKYRKLNDRVYVSLRSRANEDVSNWVVCMIHVMYKNGNYAKWHRVLEKVFAGMKLAKVEQ
ncbi:MAG: hypothetical protein P4M00_09565 [Azospirillaceae bacterium]|nr:hypothetical protein [Azospirillaceae bacterium]